MVKQTDRDASTERRILDAAHSVFVRRGTAGARVQEIAREAGVNAALLHYYFRSKERLAEAVFRRVAGELVPAVLAVLSSDRPLDAKVRAVVALELDQLSAAPYLPGYVIGEVTHQPERAAQLVATVTGMVPVDAGRTVVETLGRQISEQVALGLMAPIAPDQFIVNLLSLCVYPFAARPLLCALLGMDQAAFDGFIDRRRTDVPRFFLGALRP